MNKVFQVSAGPEVVSRSISSSEDLRRKTVVVVIEGLCLSLYRDSSSKGLYSRDVYMHRDNKWVFDYKDGKKYIKPPSPPMNSIKYELNGISLWSMDKLGDNQKKEIQKLL